MKTTVFNIVVFLLIYSSGIRAFAQTNLSLEDAIELASKGNKTLNIQNLQELSAKQAVREAKSAFLPNIDFNGNLSRYFDRQVIYLPGSFAGTEKAVQDVSVGGLHQYDAVISLNQKLFSKSSKEDFKASKIAEEIENENTADMEGQLIHEVTKSFYQVLLSQNQLMLLEKSLHRNEKALQDAKSLLIQGKGLKTDTLQSYIAVENLKTSLHYQRSSVDIAKTQLKQLIGLNEEVDISLEDIFQMGEKSEDFYIQDQEFPVDELTRHDLSIQKLNIELEERKLSAIKATRVPEVSLIGQYQLQSQDDNFGFKNQPWQNTSLIAVNLSFPIFSGGRTSAKTKQALIRLDQEKLRMDALYDEVKLEISTISNEWSNAKMQYATQKKNVEAAQLNYSMVNQRYINGIGSKLEISDAELALTSSQFNYLQAFYNLKIYSSDMQKALGRLKF